MLQVVRPVEYGKMDALALILLSSIHPASRFKIAWDSLILLVLLSVCLCARLLFSRLLRLLAFPFSVRCAFMCMLACLFAGLHASAHLHTQLVLGPRCTRRHAQRTTCLTDAISVAGSRHSQSASTSLCDSYLCLVRTVS